MDAYAENISRQVRAIEERLRLHKIKIDRFCVDIGIARSTWQHWKAGRNLPYWVTWQKVLEAVPKGRPPVRTGAAALARSDAAADRDMAGEE